MPRQPPPPPADAGDTGTSHSSATLRAPAHANRLTMPPPSPTVAVPTPEPGERFARERRSRRSANRRGDLQGPIERQVRFQAQRYRADLPQERTVGQAQ